MHLALLIALLQPTPSTVERLSVMPKDTDPKISTFTSAHSIFTDPKAKKRNQLLVYLPGTNGRTRNTDAFCTTAAELGYQVINLMYPNDISATVTRRESSADGYLNFRLEVIEGKDLSKSIQISRTESIENRLTKALRYLDKTRPKENWGRYLTSDDQLRWQDIAVAGLSQGAGHAAVIAARHKVARAVLFGGPKDYDKATSKPANWYSPSLTPAKSIYTFNHEQDNQGCNLAEQLQICAAMGLDKLGKAVDVDTTKPPFANSHILTTNYPGTKIPSTQAHGSVVGDTNTPKSPDGTRLFKPVWVYMLTAVRE